MHAVWVTTPIMVFLKRPLIVRVHYINNFDEAVEQHDELTNIIIFKMEDIYFTVQQIERRTRRTMNNLY